MRSFLFTLLIAISFSGQGQTLNQLFAESTKAYESKNMSLFLQLNLRMDSIRPSHPKVLYNLACAFALNNEPQEAILTLKKLILMNNTTAFEADEDLVSLKQLNEYKELVKLKTSLSTVIKNSKQVTELSEKDLHPEGILYLQKSNLWLSGSIRKHKIVSFDIKTGKCNDWLTDKTMLSVFALKADANEEFLWAAASSVPEMDNHSIENNGKGELLKIDLKTRTLVKRYSLDDGHVFGDLVISKKGSVYISDSEQPFIYTINNDQLVPFVNLENEVFNLQGLVLNEDESVLLIADYLKGILKINLNDLTKRTWLEFPEGIIPKGIDGLVFYKESLIAIHNGVIPIRIMRYSLNNDETKITKSTIIDNAREEFKEPTLACLAGNKLYFIANAPWSLYNKNFTLDESKLKAPLLFRFTIEDQ